jgi:hypothetical protein
MLTQVVLTSLRRFEVQGTAGSLHCPRSTCLIVPSLASTSTQWAVSGGQWAVGRREKAEIRDQRSEVGGQNLVVGGQRSSVANFYCLVAAGRVSLSPRGKLCRRVLRALSKRE